MKQAIRLLTTLLLASLASLPAAEAAKPVKVFLLAGQSNMEGKAPNALLDYQATNASTKALFAHLRKDDPATTPKPGPGTRTTSRTRSLHTSRAG